MLRRLVFCIAIFVACSHAVSAASFPCYGELSTQERLICGDKGLSALDVRLNALYSVAVQLALPAEPLRAGQREWLGSVRATCVDLSCLTTAYGERVDSLMKLVQEKALPLPSTVSGKVRHAATKSPYCEALGEEGPEGGDWFSVIASVDGTSVSGSIDGIFDCGRKVWGEIEIKGRLVGHIALVEFRTGWSESRDQVAEAIIAAGPNRIYWRVLSEIRVEGYVPTAEDIRVQESPSVCDLVARPAELVMYEVDGSPDQNGDRQIVTDIDGDGLSDKISWSDSGSGSRIPADPSTVTVILSAAGKTLTLEENRLYIVKYQSSYFVVTGWFESELSGTLHTDIYAMAGTGITKICSFVEDA